MRARGSDGSPRNADMVRTGVRQGLQRLWPAVCGILTPLGPPKGGNHQSAVAGAAGHLSGKPGRRGFVMVIGYGLLVIESMPK